MSGQPFATTVVSPLVWGSGPSLRLNMRGVLTMVRCHVKTLWRYVLTVASDRKSQQAICSRVSQILRDEREKRGLSMNRVAERAGISQQMVSYVERGMRNPTLETLLRIASAIEIDFVEVMRR